MREVNYAKNAEVLDKILSSKNVKEEFYKNYTDSEFNYFLDLVIPEVLECMECEPVTLDGSYNVMEHILTSVEEMNKATKGMNSNEAKKLRYAMFIRDLVKPVYQEVHHVKNQRVDDFPYYVWGSESVANRVLTKLNFDEKDILEIQKVLRYSDIFDNVSLNPTKKNQTKLSDEFLKITLKTLNKYGDGVELLNKIILVNKVDCKAYGKEVQEKMEVLNKVSDMVEELSAQKQ